MEYTWSRGTRFVHDQWRCGECDMVVTQESAREETAVAHVRETGHNVVVSHTSWYAILPALPVPAVTDGTD